MSDLLNALNDAQAEIADLRERLAQALSTEAKPATFVRTDFLKELRDANLARVGSPTGRVQDIDGWTPADWAVNLAGEVGEALNVLKKMRRISDPALLFFEMGDAGEYQRLFQHFADELADVMICVDLLAARMRLDLESIVRRKFNLTSDKWGSDVRL